MFYNQIQNKRLNIILGVCFFVLNMAFCFLFNVQKTPHLKTPIIISSNDTKGYYEYLPWLIHKKNINYINEYSYPADTGRYLKYSYGVALCHLPFYALSSFAINHTLTYNTFSNSEYFIMSVSASIFLALAMILLFKLLSLFFESTKLKLLTIILIYGATNLFHYAVIDSAMSHLYSFFAINGFIWAILSFNEHQKKQHFLFTFLFLFFIIAIRPINVVIAIPFIFYVSYSLRKYSIIFTSFLTIVISYSVQLFLWRLQCGNWLFNSYHGEGFYWLNPEFTNVFFSFRKGLFIYSPILLFSVIGLILLFKKFKFLSICIFTSVLLFCVIVCCWWHWPFGDSYGHRAFIDVFGFAAIGLMSLFTKCKQIFLKVVVAVFLFGCTLLNIIQTYQYNQGIISAEYMNKEKYMYQFLQVGNESKNCLGGCHDIFPFSKKHYSYNDSIPYLNMDFDDYSEPLLFQSDVKNTCSYLNISLIKYELNPYESAKAKIYLQISDSLKKVKYFTAFLLNETPLDCKTQNIKTFQYQVMMPQIKPYHKLEVFISNPERENFVIKNFHATCFFVK